MSRRAEQRRRIERRQRMERIHHGWARGRVRPLDIRAGDTVLVIAGRDRGKRGVVERTIPEEQRIVVRGVNVLKRHVRAGVKGNLQGGVVDFNAPIAYSNVMLVCSRCDRPTRIGHQRREDGTSVIVCRRCGEVHERAGVSR
jgi:large subunit ribosomal protein L24